jgi:hypothetical protein
MTYADFVGRKQRYIDMLEAAGGRTQSAVPWNEEDLQRVHEIIVGTVKGWSILDIPSRLVWERHYQHA